MASVTASYLRFSPVSELSSVYCDISKFQLKNSGSEVFGLSNASSAVITANNGGFNSVYTPENIVVNNGGFGYLATVNNPVIDLHFSSPITFDEFSFVGYNSYLSSAHVQSFILESSNDGVHFSTVSSGSNLSFSDNVTQSFASVAAVPITYYTQAELDAAILAATSGLFTQADLDSAVSAAVSSSFDKTAFLDNISGVDIASVKSAVTFSKTKLDYVANPTDKIIIGNALANHITSTENSISVSGGDGDGDDEITTFVGNDTISGGKGNDVIHADDGNNKVDGADGNDTIYSGSGNDSISGGKGHDLIVAGFGNNKVDGSDGDDQLITYGGNDTISGGKDNDLIDAGSGNNKIDGGDGNDSIFAGSGNDSISGGAGTDSISGGVGADTIDGGKGDDFIYSFGANSKLSGGDGNDSISLTAFDSSFVASSVDTLDGGTGSDSLTISGFSGKHKLLGGAGDDTLIHDFNGSATLDGGAGNDILRSVNSTDVLTGGADSDIFDLSYSYASSIKITDFKSTVDTLLFSPISSARSHPDSSHFVTSTTDSFSFPTADDSYAYNTKTGALFRDYDGSGSDFAQFQVALLGKVPLVASDILF